MAAVEAKKRTSAGRPRNPAEVQDSDADRFAAKLQSVLRECGRVLRDEGLLIFTYHHSRDEGWEALADAVLGAGFTVVNSQPVKAEMSVATPKSQAKDPIQLDIILVCRKASKAASPRPEAPLAIEAAKAKIRRLQAAGFDLSRNDQKIVVIGQLLTTLEEPDDVAGIAIEAETAVDAIRREKPSKRANSQLMMFE